MAFASPLATATSGTVEVAPVPVKVVAEAEALPASVVEDLVRCFHER